MSAHGQTARQAFVLDHVPYLRGLPLKRWLPTVPREEKAEERG